MASSKLKDSNLSDPFMGRLLLASPYIEDPRFKKCVILVCGHDESGSMGIIINQPNIDITLLELLEQANSNTTSCNLNPNIYQGGPVETDRVFVLHSNDYKSSDDTTYQVSHDISITANIDILNDIAACKGPKHYIIAIGYASWEPGQLETELISNDWFLFETDPDFVFYSPPNKIWNKSWENLGVNPNAIVNTMGNS